MKPGGGSKKGSAFERDIAREMSAWYFGSEGYLWRRPGPGTRFFNQEHRHTGDIVPSVDKPLPKPWPYHVECKFVKDLGLSRLLTDPEKSFIKRTWYKAYEEHRNDLEIILLVKENHRPPIAFLQQETYVTLGLDFNGTTEIIFPDPNGDIVIGLPWHLIRDESQASTNDRVESGAS